MNGRNNTVSEALHLVAERLAAAGVPGPEVDARALVAYATGLDAAGLVLERARRLTRGEERELARLTARRERREPLQWLVGTEFHGLSLSVGPGVLVPRPETEMLVELALARIPSTGTVVDVGTGSGAIALAVKVARPGLRVIGTDLSERALAVAAENANALGIAVDFLLGDLLAGIGGPLVAVLSNPPYLPASDAPEVAEEVRLDPPEALYAGPDGLAVARRLLPQVLAALESGGLLALELDPRNVVVLAAELDPAYWQDPSVEPDLVGRERFLLARKV